MHPVLWRAVVLNQILNSGGMKRARGFVFVWLLWFGSVAGQNLVPNPSFEEHTDCPDNENQVHYATGWDSHCLTPDYFNVCSPNPHLSVPYNWYGSYQPAADGEAFCGFFAYWNGVGNWSNVRDHIGAQLLSPLVSGKEYHVSIKVSLAYNGTSAVCATSHVGVKFSTVSHEVYGDTVTSPLVNNHAHVYTTSVITDTVNWITVSGSFVADSAYEYVVIGNFFTDDQVDTLMVLPAYPYCKAYYYVDDVCVSENPEICGLGTAVHEMSDRMEVTARPNPFVSFTEVYLKQPNAESEVALFDMAGKRQAVSYSIMRAGEGMRIRIERGQLSAGIYLLRAWSGDEYLSTKLSIIH